MAESHGDQGEGEGFAYLTPRSPALAYFATPLTLLSISSWLLKRSQLHLSSSCRDMHASQPLPHPPGSAWPPVRSQSVE